MSILPIITSEVNIYFDIVKIVNIIFVLSFIILGYLIINTARLLIKRLQPQYLYRSVKNTYLKLIILEAVFIFSALIIQNNLSLKSLYIFSGFQLFVCASLLYSTKQNIKASKPHNTTRKSPISELPSITVCIPARNEDKDLEECLTSILSSDYTKLEVIVLDDCSQNKRTPEVIRNFAQSGVRFIAGQEPPEHWLAKNYAYKQIADVANGELLLFCGVDSRFTPTTISKLINMSLNSNLNMLSVMPHNIQKDGNDISRSIIQPTRYAWELVLPRWSKKRNPVLSTCWLIKSSLLKEVGSFDSVRRKCVPESYFAYKSGGVDNGYAFVISDDNIGLKSVKNISSQKRTAIRVRYPQLRRQPENIALVSILEFIVLLLPFVIFAGAIFAEIMPLIIISGSSALILSIIYGWIVSLTFRTIKPIGYTVMPFAVIYDIIILNLSMWQYEFGKVYWKGRNICLPILNYSYKLEKLKSYQDLE